MIAVMGDASLSFIEKEGGVFSSEVSGYGYRVAKTLTEMGAFPALFSSLGNDETGSRIVEQFVLDQILFDPDISRLPFKTNISVRYLSGAVIDFFQHSASSLLSQEALQASLSVHTNIKAVHLSTKCLSFNPISSTYSDQALFIQPKPFILLDLNESSTSSVLDRSVSNLLPYTDLVIMCDESFDKETLDDAKLAIIHHSTSIDIYRNGELISTINKDGYIKNEYLSASILHELEKSGFLPSDGEDFKSYDVPSSLIEEIIKAL